MVNIIINKDRDTRTRQVSLESRLSRKISNRSLNNEDVHFILKNGDASLKRQLDRKMNEVYQEKKHINRMYNDDFDFRRNDGTLVKPLGELEL